MMITFDNIDKLLIKLEIIDKHSKISKDLCQKYQIKNDLLSV